MMSRTGQWCIASLFIAAMAALFGCNLITGSSDLRAVDGDPEPAGAAGSGAGPGFGGSGADSTTSTDPTGGSGGGPSNGGTGPTGGTGGTPNPGPLAYADGVTLTDLDLYQAVRRPLVSAGQPASSTIPIVAGRAGMLRVFYSTDGSYNGQPVTTRLTVDGEPPVDAVATLSGASSQQNLGSTINLQVPGPLLQPGAVFKVELLQPSATTSGANAAAAYPSTGDQTSMGVEQGGVKLKILLVPVEYYGSLPDTTPAQVQRYVAWFSETYPIPEVEVTVRQQAHAFGGNLGSYYGWSQLLDEVTDLRYQDNAADDIYYYGIHDANSSGLLGLGWVGGANDVWSRAAIGVGWTGETAPQTAIHEVGHNHGREHAPCGVTGDPYYPHAGAAIGVWGYSPSANQLLSPNDYVDFMSYCDPIWISDYTFEAIFQRAKIVSTSPAMLVPPELRDRTYDRIKIFHDQAYWKDAVTLPAPPGGQPQSVELVRGRSDRQTVTARFFPYDHLPGGMLYVMRPKGAGSQHAATWAQFTREGNTFTLAR